MGTALLLLSHLLWPGLLPEEPPAEREATAQETALVTVPPGPVAEILAGLESDSPVAPLGAPWPTWEERSPTGWGGESPWRRWVELLRAEAHEGASPARRAQLATLARLQGRDGDAWAHFRACAAEPPLLAALLPLFSPGIPLEYIGRKEALPNGVLLAPALPPTEEPRAGLRWMAGTKIECHELRVGEALCSLRVSVDRDGLEVRMLHLGGGSARVRIRPPLPRGIDPGILFDNWEKQPGHEGPIEFILDAESGEQTLWLTFHPPDSRWPSPAANTLRPPDPEREIRLVSPGGDEAHLRRFAEALGELFGVRARLVPENTPPESGLEPLVLGFGTGRESAERKLLDFIGLVETLHLSAPER